MQFGAKRSDKRDGGQEREREVEEITMLYHMEQSQQIEIFVCVTQYFFAAE